MASGNKTRRKKVASATADDQRWIAAWAYILQALSRGLDAIAIQNGRVSEELSDRTDPAKRIRIAENLKTIDWQHHYERPLFWMGVSLARLMPFREFVEIIDPRRGFTWLRLMHEKRLGEDKFNYDPPIHDFPKIIAFSRACMGQNRAYMLYGKSMSALIAEGRRGTDRSFLNAVRADPAALFCKPVRHRYQKAIAIGEDDFLRGVQNALSEPGPAEYEHSRLELALHLLTHARQIHRLNRQNAAELFIDRTHLYNGSGKDTERSLWQKIYRWKKQHSTLIQEKMSS
ncbi:MAG: hypothetical protein E6R07_01170 [Nevskiaceae bacterium]|nr:MAG: hypothetical protein E6R07_01170 [Nevskiaceae bacterium]